MDDNEQDVFEAAFDEDDATVAQSSPVNRGGNAMHEFELPEPGQMEDATANGASRSYGLDPLARERAEVAALFDADDSSAVQSKTSQAAQNGLAAQDAEAKQEAFTEAAPDFDKSSFGAAFKHFRQGGAKDFTWRGKKYSTELAAPAKRGAGASKGTSKPSPATAPASPAPEAAASQSPQAAGTMVMDEQAQQDAASAQPNLSARAQYVAEQNRKLVEANEQLKRGEYQPFMRREVKPIYQSVGAKVQEDAPTVRPELVRHSPQEGQRPADLQVLGAKSGHRTPFAKE